MNINTFIYTFNRSSLLRGCVVVSFSGSFSFCFVDRPEVWPLLWQIDDVPEIDEDLSGTDEDVPGIDEDVLGADEDVLEIDKDVSGTHEDLSGTDEGIRIQGMCFH